jgi:hypothetical protein
MCPSPTATDRSKCEPYSLFFVALLLAIVFESSVARRLDCRNATQVRPRCESKCPSRDATTANVEELGHLAGSKYDKTYA